ncbi:PREDICTED: protein ITFG3 [Condylura cristata]|uniref:protein ITFG3 n=1 Tax=Condylura cristata TaxID=143302 RepID=UPI0006434ACE|nr:PREDICTED: protein ITFG3 [Condylura cristata]
MGSHRPPAVFCVSRVTQCHEADHSGLWDVHTMTDSKDLEAEIHPLRREGPGGPPAPPRRLSRCRALAFFLSLALCLLVVLVVSFVIPCPERPASRGTWRVELSSAGEPRPRPPAAPCWGADRCPEGPARGRRVHPVLYVTRTGAHYVLLPCASSLCGYSVKSLYETAGRDSSLRRDPAWEDRLDPATHRLPWRSPGAVRHVLLVPGRAGQDLFLVGTEACVLLDGQELAPRWTLEAAQVFRGSRQSRVGPGPRGGRPHPRCPQDQSGPRHTLYLFHPTLPGVLLELTNVSAPIAASHVGLFETSRHAACVILTGPAGLDAPGPVSVAKHTVRDLVMAGRVVRTAPGGRDSDQAARDRLLRLRYRAEA